MWNLPFFEFLILLHGVLGTTQENATLLFAIILMVG
jgi:hypothetical protein